MMAIRPRWWAEWCAALLVTLGSSVQTTAESPTGSVAILRDDLPVGGTGLAEGVASAPDHLSAVLRDAGFAVSRLDAGQLGDGGVLSRGRFDLLILPYGPSFPVTAADVLRRFLREGGKLISVGGYAFDNLLTQTDTGWQPYRRRPPEGPRDVRWRYDVPAGELRGRGMLTFSGWMRTDRVVGSQFAFMAVYQYDGAGTLLEFKDVCQVTGTTPWRSYSHRFGVNDQAARVTLFAGMWMCAGRAWYDEIRLTDAAGKVIVDAAGVPGAPLDTLREGAWYRPHKTLCSLDRSVRHGGQASLRAELHYADRGERLNTRHGKPRDGLHVEPTQLGVFDADYRIRRARSLRAAPDQHVFKAGWSIDASGSGKGIRGYAASAVLGSNAARWRPLLASHDRYGRLRGAAGALVHHYGGPWKGSSWALFGLTSHDVFAAGRTGTDAALVRLAEHLVRDVYLVSTTTDRACYRLGETVRLTTTLYNGGRRPVKTIVRVSVSARGHDPPAYRDVQTVTVAPGAAAQVKAEWSAADLDGGFGHVRAELSLASAPERPIDVVEGGFVVADDGVLASGPRLTYHDNYLHVDGRPMFMFGTDDWIYVFNTTRETPLQWRRDMEKRRDFGVTIYENLQFGLPASASAQASLFNKVQGLVQLAQQYRQVYFPCMLCGYDVAVDDATLEKHARYVEAFAGCFARVPGLIYYLNGDLRCRISEAVGSQLNAFLRARYRDDAALRSAWCDPKLRLDQVTAAEYPETGAAWSDLRAYDLNVFRTSLIRRWHDPLIDAIRRHDRAHPITSEFYQLPHAGVDVPAAIGRLDLSNIGFFEEPLRDLRRVPSILKYSDLRSRGKSFGPGEYGVKTHPAWAGPDAVGYHKARTPAQAIDLFLTVAHYALGLGASRIHNWCWKDSSHHVFPWGMVYPCDEVEKDTAYVHRNQSLLFRHLRPVYTPPSVYVLTPDTHRLGGQKRTVIEGILSAIQMALGCHVAELGMLNEHALRIPPVAKVIFLPIPFCLTDAAYGQVLDFVRGGGTLYVSGDVSFDPLRRRTHLERLTELCGVTFVRQCYPNIDFARGVATTLCAANGDRPELPGAKPCIEVTSAGATPLWRSQEGRGVVFRHGVGRGQVIFSTDPIELRTDRASIAQHVALYHAVLDTARVRPVKMKPDSALVHVMRVGLQDGGRVTVFYNADEDAGERAIACDVGGAAGEVTLTIRRQRPALLWSDGAGRLRAAEVQGELRIGDVPRLDDGTDGIVLSLDGQDLRDSTAMVLMPLRAGRVKVATRVDWHGAIAEVGEVRHGRWHGFERVVPAMEAGWLSVDVDAEQAFSLVLVCNEAELPCWRERIRRSMTHPVSAE